MIETHVSHPIVTGISNESFITSKMVEKIDSLKEQLEREQFYSIRIKNQLSYQRECQSQISGFHLCLIFEDGTEINKDCAQNLKSASSTIRYYTQDPFFNYSGPKLKQYIIVLDGRLWDKHSYK